MFILSIANINKALYIKTYIDLKEKLLLQYYKYLDVFN